MKKQTFPLIDTHGNAPVRSEYRTPVCLLANALQYMMFATVSDEGNSGSGSCWMLGIGWSPVFDVLLIPFGGRFMWPLAVAGLGGRYLVTRALVRLGHPSKNPARIAFSIVDIGGLYSD